VVREGDGTKVAGASEYPYFCIEDEADALLIASAPDLSARLRASEQARERLEAALRDILAAIDVCKATECAREDCNKARSLEAAARAALEEGEREGKDSA
jgi:hypothetical protein